MGQGSSTATSPPSTEELTLLLTDTFTKKCFTAHELSCYKENFSSLAEEDQSGAKYWSKPTLIEFLGLPDTLGWSAVIFHLCGYLGAFPFPSCAPAVLTEDSLLRVVCLMTRRHVRVLRTGKEAWVREIWKGCASFDQEASVATKKTNSPEGVNGEAAPQTNGQETTGLASTKDPVAADESEEDERQEEDDEDDLAFLTFELMDALDVFNESEKVSVQNGVILSDNFLKLLDLLVLIAPLEHQENVTSYTTQLNEERLHSLRAVTTSIMASFGVEQKPGIGCQTFEEVVSSALPHLFDSFGPLFENFLVQKDTNAPETKSSALGENIPLSSSEDPNPEAIQKQDIHISAPEALLPVHGNILNIDILSQLSFIFSDKSIFHRIHPLYLGDEHGYSMGAFERSVFKWQEPSILLVSGTIISPTTRQGLARSFLEDLPHRRLSSGVLPSPNPPLLGSSAATVSHTERIIYGAYVPVPWEATKKTTFGTDKTTLFQLSPVHDVFPAASSPSQNYVYFNKPSSMYSGLGFGSPLPNYSSMASSQQSGSSFNRRSSISAYSAHDTAYGSSSTSSFSGPSSPGLTRRSSLLGDEQIPLGPISLHINDALQFGVFTHLASGGAGSFERSKLPASARPGTSGDWQDQFEIDSIEVWGLKDA